MIKKIILLLVLVFIVTFCVESRTDGFITSKLYFTLPVKVDRAVYEKFNCSEKMHDQIIDQPFTYLAKGTQFFVFESADKNYVIKFLRPKLLQPKSWVYLLHFPKFLDLYRKEEILHRKQKCQKTLRACFIAFEKIGDRLGLLGMYLKNQSNKRLNVKSKQGHRFSIDLGNTCYIIQKKADMFLDSALLSAKQNSQEEVEKIIDLFLQGITYRCKHQISNTDPNVFSNFALLEGHVVEVDFGDFFDNEILLPPPLFTHEINRYAKSFKKWAKLHLPEVLPYFDEKLREELQEYEKYFEKNTF